MRFGLKKGEVLDVREDRGRLVMTKTPRRDSVDALYGVLKLGQSTDELMEELRGHEEIK